MNKILLGDCQEVLKTIGSESVHLTCTSPPYYNAREYSTWSTYDDYLNF
jgi:DNA modification methylase